MHNSVSTMSNFLTLRVLRDLADGPTIAYTLQQKYQKLKFCQGSGSAYNALRCLCDNGYAHKEKIGFRNRYFITTQGLELLEYFQFDRDKN